MAVYAARLNSNHLQLPRRAESPGACIRLLRRKRTHWKQNRPIVTGDRGLRQHTKDAVSSLATKRHRAGSRYLMHFYIVYRSRVRSSYPYFQVPFRDLWITNPKLHSKGYFPSGNDTQSLYQHNKAGFSVQFGTGGLARLELQISEI